MKITIFIKKFKIIFFAIITLFLFFGMVFVVFESKKLKSENLNKEQFIAQLIKGKQGVEREKQRIEDELRQSREKIIDWEQQAASLGFQLQQKESQFQQTQEEVQEWQQYAENVEQWGEEWKQWGESEVEKLQTEVVEKEKEKLEILEEQLEFVEEVIEKTEKDTQYDTKRVNDINSIVSALRDYYLNYWTYPDSLSTLQGKGYLQSSVSIRDPETRNLYYYKPLGDTYILCARESDAIYGVNIGKCPEDNDYQY